MRGRVKTASERVKGAGEGGGHLAEGVPWHAHANCFARLGLAGEIVHALLGHCLARMQDQRVLRATHAPLHASEIPRLGLPLIPG